MKSTNTLDKDVDEIRRLHEWEEHTNAYQQALERNAVILCLLAGLGGKWRASRVGFEKLSHFSHMTL